MRLHLIPDVADIEKVCLVDYRAGRRPLLDSDFAERYADKLQLGEEGRFALRPRADFRAVVNSRYRFTFPTQAGKLRADWNHLGGGGPLLRGGAFNAKAITQLAANAQDHSDMLNICPRRMSLIFADIIAHLISRRRAEILGYSSSPAMGFQVE